MKKILSSILILAGGILSASALSIESPTYLSPVDETLEYDFDYLLSEQQRMLGIIRQQITNPRNQLKQEAVNELNRLYSELIKSNNITALLIQSNQSMRKVYAESATDSLSKMIEDSDANIIDQNQVFKGLYIEANKIPSMVDNFEGETGLGNPVFMDDQGNSFEDLGNGVLRPLNEGPNSTTWEGRIGTAVSTDDDDEPRGIIGTPFYMDEQDVQREEARKRDRKDRDLMQKASDFFRELFNRF